MKLFCEGGCAHCGADREATYTNVLYLQLSDDKSFLRANLCWACFAKDKLNGDAIRKNLQESERFCSPCGEMVARLERIRFIDGFKYGSLKHKELRKRLGLDNG